MTDICDTCKHPSPLRCDACSEYESPRQPPCVGLGDELRGSMSFGRSSPSTLDNNSGGTYGLGCGDLADVDGLWPINQRDGRRPWRVRIGRFVGDTKDAAPQ